MAKRINLNFNDGSSEAYDYVVRDSKRYCPVYKDVGETRHVLLPVHEAPRHGWRQWENLANDTDLPSTQDITVIVGHVYCVSIGKTSANGATAICSGAFASTLTGNAVDGQTSEIQIANTTTLTITISGSITELQVEDHTSLLGKEVATNRNVTNDISEWIDASVGTGVMSWDAGRLKLTRDGDTSNRGVAQKSIVTVIGKTYLYYVLLHTDSTGKLNAYYPGESTIDITGGIPFYVLFTATATSATLSFYPNNNSSIIYIDSISVRELSNDTGVPNEYTPNGIGWSQYNNGNTVLNNVVTESIGDLIPSNTQGEVDGYGAIGSRLETNGGFDTDTAWEKDADWIISGGVASYSGTTFQKIRQDLGYSGKTVILRITIIGSTKGGLGIYSGIQHSKFIGNGKHISVFTATSKRLDIYAAQIDGDRFDGSIDNVSVELAHPIRKNYAPEQALTNSVRYPRNFGSSSSWAKSGNISYVQDQLGFDGIPNTAWTLTDNETTTSFLIYDKTVVNDNASHVFEVRVKKDLDESRMVGIGIRLLGGITQASRFMLNTVTGEIADTSYSVGIFSISILDEGDYWKLLLQTANNTTGNTLARIEIHPARGFILGASTELATGSAVIDQVELHLNTTIAEIEHASPIPNGNGSDFTKAADIFESSDLEDLFPQVTGICLFKGRFGFDSHASSPQTSLVSITNSRSSVLYQQATKIVKTYDGVNVSQVEGLYIALVPQALSSMWGPKLKAIANEEVGGIRVYKGTFETDGIFKLHYAILYPIYYDSVLVYQAIMKQIKGSNLGSNLINGIIL